MNCPLHMVLGAVAVAGVYLAGAGHLRQKKGDAAGQRSFPVWTPAVRAGHSWQSQIAHDI